MAPNRSSPSQSPGPQDQLRSREKLPRRDLRGPPVCGREWKHGAGLCWLLACKVLPTSHPVSQFFPLEFQYGWEGSRRAGASRGCSRTPLLPGERVLECLQLSTRAHARVPREPRPAPPSRVPGLSQLLLPLTASAAPKGCRCPGAERRGSAGRWSEVGRRGRRALDVRKALPHLWEDGHGGGTKKVSQCWVPRLRGADATAERQRRGPDDLPSPPPSPRATRAAPACLRPPGVGVSAPSRAGCSECSGEAPRGCSLSGCPFAKSGHRVV